jgi:hypothetical protein
VDLSFAITHTTEPSSQRHHRVWLARVSEGDLRTNHPPHPRRRYVMPDFSSRDLDAGPSAARPTDLLCVPRQIRAVGCQKSGTYVSSGFTRPVRTR